MEDDNDDNIRIDPGKGIVAASSEKIVEKITSERILGELQ